MSVTEADQLLATQIAYADFNKVIESIRDTPPISNLSEDRPVKLSDALKYAADKKADVDVSHLAKYLKPDGTFKDEYAYANDWTILAAINENETGKTGLYSCILDIGDSRILASRGSEDMSNMMNFKQDWYEADLQLINSEMTKQEAALLNFMKENAAMLNEKPWVATGHSLGGALSDFAAIMSVELGLHNFAGAINFDGPGHSQEFILKYRNQLAQVASLMTHKKASVVGNLLFVLPGVKQEFVETAPQSQFLDDEGNPYPQVTGSSVFAEHDTQNWVRNDDGSLREGQQDWYEFLTEKLGRGLDRLPSVIGNALPHVIYLAVTGANWLKKFADDHPALVAAITSAVVTFLLLHPMVAIGIAVTALVVVVVAIVIAAVIIVVEMVIEVLEKIAEEIAKAICAAVSWLAGKAVELFNAIKDAIGKIAEWFRNAFNSGARYANSNPYFKLDTAKLRNYATRINNVNNRLRNLDSGLRGLYWQVGLLDIWDILVANVLTSGSPALNQIRSYLNNAADRFETAENKARGYVGG
jgi:hypothetical protein